MVIIKFRVLTILCIILCVNIAQAQVTIGVGEVPATGALLQLKDKANIVNGSENASKGLGMPRVEITNYKPRTPAQLAASIGEVSGEEWDLEAHIGLTVYNVRNIDVCDTDPRPKGLYVWTGTEWVYLGQETVEEPTLSSQVSKLYDDRDGEVYLVRNFGYSGGTWMLENLRYVPTDGSITISTGSDGPNDKRYFYPQPGDGSETNLANIYTWEKRQGVLYSYAAVTLGRQDAVNTDQGNIDHVTMQGLCPPGWHVPSDYDWNQLESYIYNYSGFYSYVYGFNPERWDNVWDTGTRTSTGANIPWWGQAMKSICPLPGATLPTNGESYLATKGGFDGLLTGYAVQGKMVKTSNGSYGESGYFWTASVKDTNNAYFRAMGANENAVTRDVKPRNNLLSLRCVMNQVN